MDITWIPTISLMIISLTLSILNKYNPKLVNRIFLSNKEREEIESLKEKQNIKVPKGWFVYEAGQSPVHMLWFVNLVSFDDLVNNVEKPRHHWVEEQDSYEEALSKAIKLCQNDTDK